MSEITLTRDSNGIVTLYADRKRLPFPQPEALSLYRAMSELIAGVAGAPAPLPEDPIDQLRDVVGGRRTGRTYAARAVADLRKAQEELRAPPDPENARRYSFEMSQRTPPRATNRLTAMLNLIAACEEWLRRWEEGYPRSKTNYNRIKEAVEAWKAIP